MKKQKQIEQIADFLCNGIDCISTDEISMVLTADFGMVGSKAEAMVEIYLATFNLRPIVPNDELFPFIEKYL